jgi:hypothetical protein
LGMKKVELRVGMKVNSMAEALVALMVAPKARLMANLMVVQWGSSLAPRTVASLGLQMVDHLVPQWAEWWENLIVLWAMLSVDLLENLGPASVEQMGR